MKNKGQATLEFLLSFVFASAFLFAFIQLGLNSGIGYLTQYATFMASRSYMVYDDNSLNFSGTIQRAATRRVPQVLSQFGLERVGVLGRPESSVQVNGPLELNKKYEYVGVVLKYVKKMTPLSIIGGALNIDFVSESFLGKEPTRGSCHRRICEYVFAQTIGFNCSTRQNSDFATLYDNGC